MSTAVRKSDSIPLPWKQIGFWTLLLCLFAWVYAPLWRAGFIWDDAVFVQHPSVKSPDGWRTIWLTANLPDFAPLTFSMFWLERRFFGDAPGGYHVMNVLLHLAGCLVLWRVLLRLRSPVAGAVALVFAVHPVAVASAAWVAEGKNTLSFLFYCASVLAFLRFEKDAHFRCYCLSLVFFAAALMSKASVVILPLVLLLCAAWQRQRISRIDLLRTLPFFILSFLFGAVTACMQGDRFSGSSAYEAAPVLERLIAGTWALWFYLGKALFPLRLSLVYPQWEIDPLSWQAYVPAVLALAAGALLWWRRQGKGRPVLFAFAYFLIALSPVMGVFKMVYSIHSQVADHLQYLALIGPLLIVCGIWERLWHLSVAKAMACAGLSLLAALSHERLSLFADEEKLWRDVLIKHSESWDAHKNLGDTFVSRKQWSLAAAHYERAVKLNGRDPYVLNSLANIRTSQGQFDSAAELYLKALKLKPDYAHAHYGLGMALKQSGATEEALAQFICALKCEPNYAEAHLDAGNIFFYRGKLEQALRHYSQAAALRPAWDNAHYNRGIVLSLLGETNEAARCWHKALLCNPRHEGAQSELQQLSR